MFFDWIRPNQAFAFAQNFWGQIVSFILHTHTFPAASLPSPLHLHFHLAFLPTHRLHRFRALNPTPAAEILNPTLAAETLNPIPDAETLQCLLILPGKRANHFQVSPRPAASPRPRYSLDASGLLHFIFIVFSFKKIGRSGVSRVALGFGSLAIILFRWIPKHESAAPNCGRAILLREFSSDYYCVLPIPCWFHAHGR